ncbi:amino acid-binding protein [Actinopolymorpha alba]|uniref:amino acid-binding protein n=1 Tax=Actinopolymorpha alba TaxID=533267 RepID=UPI001ED98B57|nr:amino acid-binding protein [Actinopolymorpha alba]
MGGWTILGVYLLRIALPDQPGALGTVASALGRAGGDIVAVDVVAREADGTAVDDFVVELPLGGRADSLVSACQSVPGVRVIWLSRYAAGGNLRRDLEVVEAMTARPAEAERLLVEHAPSTFRADWAFLVSRADLATTAEVHYATIAAPDLPGGNAFWFPLDHAIRLTLPAAWADQGWRHVAAAAVPLGAPDRALVIGRSGGPEILDSELARMAHLAALAQTVRRALAPDEDAGAINGG